MAEELTPQPVEIVYLLNLVTSQHNQQPRYMQTVALSVDPYIHGQNTSNSYWTLFDLDTSVGQQEDMLGEWVGITRYVTIDVPSFFTFNNKELGFDKGRWYTAHEVSKQQVRLGDEDYRFLLRARIIANYWDGTIEGAYYAWDTLFRPYNLTVLIQDGFPRSNRYFSFDDQTGGTLGFDASIWWEDQKLQDIYFQLDNDHPNNVLDKGLWSSVNQQYYVPPEHDHGNMSIAQVLVGDKPITPLFQALFSGGYLGLKSAGVGTSYYIQYQIEGPDYSVGLPIFGFDVGPNPPPDQGFWPGMWWVTFDVQGLGHDEAPLFYPTGFPADRARPFFTNDGTDEEGLDEGWWDYITEPDFYFAFDIHKDRNGFDYGQWVQSGRITWKGFKSKYGYWPTNGVGWFPPPYPTDQPYPPTGVTLPPYNITGFDLGTWAWQLNWHDRII